MSEINEKQPATVANLTNSAPVAIKYNRALIKKIALVVILLLVGSLFVVVNKQEQVELPKEEQTIFEHITPRLYNKEYQYHAQQELEKQKIGIGEVDYAKNTVTTEQEVLSSEHNLGLLKEYFEQQALIKIKEDDDARISPMAFAVNLNLGNDKAVNAAGSNNDYLVHNPSQSSKLLKAGSIIPCVLSTSINSDLPGMVLARVRENIFDSATGRFLLIPQGSTLVGKYDNNVQFGQDRVQIVFHRIDLPPNTIYPNGHTIEIDNATSSDLSGHAGMSDSVDNHYGKIAMGVTLSSLFMAMGKEPRDDLYYRDRLVNKASENISSIANKIADKQMNQSPTITIRGGLPFNVMVAKDLHLQPS